MGENNGKREDYKMRPPLPRNVQIIRCAPLPNYNVEGMTKTANTHPQHCNSGEGGASYNLNVSRYFLPNMDTNFGSSPHSNVKLINRPRACTMGGREEGEG